MSILFRFGSITIFIREQDVCQAHVNTHILIEI